MVFRNTILLLRPRQWIKNAFVLAPLVFSKELFVVHPLIAALEALVAFCLTASCVYIINDISDIEADRAHPEKRNRPLAAGLISRTQALIVVAVLFGIALLLALETNLRFQLVLVVYFMMNLAYSAKLKEIVLVDVFIIAAGFMLRVLGGAFAIDVQVSGWIVLCTLFVSLFLGFAKRRGELLLVQQVRPGTERKVLTSYSVNFIDQMLTIAAAGTVISYALYTVAPRTIEIFGTEKMIYTTVFVIYGMFRYLYLIHMRNSTENPTNAVLSDLSIVAVTILWGITCIAVIYFGGKG
ncbi:MAG TPA: decaprenyl-phosphate phosphoribosyltransferase [Bacteroidetes bacterium]|nr:decaprenyl-phosphate phosphoribosyltransferase [Bacteroidota bacterium]